MIDRARLELWMQGREDEHCEFKRAENDIDSDDLADYCIALANEGGGHLILGVTDKLPRQVVGSKAFPNPEKVKHSLLQRIHLRIETAELNYDGNRVLIFSAPARPVGTPLQHGGRYLMRCGGSLTGMTPERLQAIFDERQPDFSALVVPGASLADLDPAAIKRFRGLWHRKNDNDELLRRPTERLLADAELIDAGGRVTQAALILLGTYAALGRYLRQAEVVFEYRSSDGSIPYQQRKEYRQGFLLYDDDLWNTINLRNEVQPVRDGLFIGQIRSFNEEVVREAVLNAICHRDYRLGEAVFVRQYPSRLEVESPGGLPGNITPETIIERQFRRNPLVAEALQKCGLVERSSQGVDKMFRLMIQESKRRPDYSDSDEGRVLVRLYAEVQDPEFLNFIQKVGKQKKLTFDLGDLLRLDDIRQGKVRVADELTRKLVSRGVVEKVGRGRGTRYILSKHYYALVGQKGIYTRERGLGREANKGFILQHLEHHSQGRIQEFHATLPHLTRGQIHSLLKELKREGRIRFVGPRNGGYWEKTEGAL